MLKSNEIIKIINECNNLLNKSYCPYSNFAVSAIVFDENDNKYFGVNIENSSYGLSICAERNAISSAVFNGMRTIKYIFVSAQNVNTPISPCGACRQVLREFSNENTKIILANANNKDYLIYGIDDILPYSFDKSSL